MDAHKNTSAAQLAAKQIFQKFLDEMSIAVLHYDEPAVLERIRLPLRMTTLGADLTLETEEDWLRNTRRVHQSLRAMGVNHYIRLVHTAEFLSENYIEGIYVTHTLSNAVPMVPAYENRATLTRIDGVWKLTLLETSMTNEQFPIAIPRIDPTKSKRFSPSTALDDARRAIASPLAVYQDFMDALSRANMEGDFDTWCKMCEFPHDIHFNEVDETIACPAEVMPFFNMLRGQIEEKNVTDIRRVATRAEFTSATTICGYHDCTLYSGDKIALGPVASRYILNRTGTLWRAVSITNSLKNSEFPYKIPELSDALVSLREIHERTTRQ